MTKDRVRAEVKKRIWEAGKQKTIGSRDSDLVTRQVMEMQHNGQLKSDHAIKQYIGLWLTWRMNRQ